MLRYFDITGGDKKKLIETISSYYEIESEYWILGKSKGKYIDWSED